MKANFVINDYSSIAGQYASLDNSGTAFLAFKTIPWIIKQYATGTKTLDYGCGSGSSTLFLKELGLEVDGVDISEAMLFEARKTNKNISNNVNYNLIQSAVLPYENDIFDIVFSSFVFFEIPSKNELKEITKEIFRVLKSGSVFIIVTGSMELYKHNWLSLDVNFEQNTNLNSGDIAKVLLKDANLIVNDYYWTDTDYQEVIAASGFTCLHKLQPLGEERDGYLWIEENKFPPYVIYVLLKQ